MQISKCSLNLRTINVLIFQRFAAFNYAIVSHDAGADFVHKYVGHEPSGRLFNEICLDCDSKFLMLFKQLKLHSLLIVEVRMKQQRR